jgi:two-component system LytT family sensor kinase
VRKLKKNIHWVLSLLMLAALGIHVYMLQHVLQLSWTLSLQDGIISTVILGGGVWAIILLISAYPTSAAVTLYALVVALLVSGLITLSEYEIIKLVVRSEEVGYIEWLGRSLPIRFFIILVFNVWMATVNAFRKNMAELESRFQLQADASILLKEAELFKLRQQLQPHFLYNSLNSISALIMIAPDKAQEMIGKLSDFLRSSVKRESEDTMPIEEELKYIESYLAIESVRFGDRLQIHFEKEYTDDAAIPPFLLQPILENAIKFGLYGNTGVVEIMIHILLERDMLILTITNPFDPNMQPPKGTGFGLTGIQRRLYLIYARTDLLETLKDDETFTTTLKIPQQHV